MSQKGTQLQRNDQFQFNINDQFQFNICAGSKSENT